jgi:hypothetical protein
MMIGSGRGRLPIAEAVRPPDRACAHRRDGRCEHGSDSIELANPATATAATFSKVYPAIAIPQKKMVRSERLYDPDIAELIAGGWKIANVRH